MDGIFQQPISLTGSFNLWLALTVFAIAFISEFGFSIPCLLETIWLLVGYHVIGGNISPQFVLVFFAITMIGRGIGAVILYIVIGYGKHPLKRLFNNLAKNGPDAKPSGDWLKGRILTPVVSRISRPFTQSSVNGAGQRSNLLKWGSKLARPSACNVALGRFIWLKIPLTIAMSMTRRPVALLVGVALFSLLWDGLYITLGTVGAGNQISPAAMLPGTIGALLIINTAVYFVRRHSSSRRLADADN